METSQRLEANTPEPDDESFLDVWLERFVSAIHAGTIPECGPAILERPHLSGRLHAVLATANTIAVCRARTPPRLGDHEILGELGRGGMGMVYLARDIRLSRTVALKTLANPLAQGPTGKERFEREARAVARLQHPHIAQVFEFGEADGTSYYTMELVDGRSLAQLLRALRERGKGVAELRGPDLASGLVGQDSALPATWQRGYVEAASRIALEIALALQHAHEHGVVHRDVKPSNILVRRTGQAVLCDFGLALTGDGGRNLTRSGEAVGTPQYMAPEQIDRSRTGPGAWSDVFSLGVTLYELLTLTLPFTGESALAAQRAIVTAAPTPPSRLNSQIPRDLEIICLHALEKDPAHRYASAAEFAEDLDRFLTLRPIRARPIGFGTRTLRYVQRNRTTTALLATLAVLVLGAPTALWWQERAANLRIQSEATKSARMYEFVAKWLTAADPSGAGPEAKIADILESAAQKLETDFAELPEIRASLLYLLGQTYLEIQLPQRAELLLTRSHLLRESTLGSRHPDTLSALNDLGRARAETRHLDEAEELLSRGLALAREALEPDHEITLSLEHNLGYVALLREDWALAEARYEPLLARRENKIGPTHDQTMMTLLNLGLALSWQGKPAQALALLEPAYLSRKADRPNDPITLYLQNNLVNARIAQGNYAEALDLATDLCSRTAHSYGEGKPITLWRQGMRAEALRCLDRLAQAEAVLLPAVEASAALGATHETRLMLLDKLARLRGSQGRHADAEQTFAQVRAARETLNGAESPLCLQAAYEVACSISQQGRYREAEQALAEVMKHAGRWPENTVQRWIYGATLGWCALHAGDLATAEAWLVPSCPRLMDLMGRRNRETLRALNALVRLYGAKGDSERQSFYQCVLRAVLPKDK